MGLFDFLKNQSKLTVEKPDRSGTSNKDELKIHLDNIQKEIYLFLKPLGFKKKGRTFNRQTEEGIYQVINIQSGRYGNCSGKFTINLGVAIKDIYELEGSHDSKDFYQEYDCQIRTRLTSLTIKQDQWWSIFGVDSQTSAEVIEGLNSHGLQWLDSFENRDKICRNLGNVAGGSPRAKLDVALIEFKRDRVKGEKLFRDYYDGIQSHKEHKAFVRGLAMLLEIKLSN